MDLAIGAAFKHYLAGYQKAWEIQQKEITKLNDCVGLQRKAISDLEKLREENKKLRECAEFYADNRRGLSIKELLNHDSPWYATSDDFGSRARQCLKELEVK